MEKDEKWMKKPGFRVTTWRKYCSLHSKMLKNFACGAENGWNWRIYGLKAFQDSKISA